MFDKIIIYIMIAGVCWGLIAVCFGATIMVIREIRDWMEERRDRRNGKK